jgi:hypothetical protein
LLEARDEKRLLRLQRQLAGYKLLIIDELGYVPLSQTGAELLFEVFSQRYERGSTVVTSNLPFDEWTSAFGSERLTGVLPPRRSGQLMHFCSGVDTYDEMNAWLLDKCVAYAKVAKATFLISPSLVI